MAWRINTGMMVASFTGYPDTTTAHSTHGWSRVPCALRAGSCLRAPLYSRYLYSICNLRSVLGPLRRAHTLELYMYRMSLECPRCCVLTGTVLKVPRVLTAVRFPHDARHTSEDVSVGRE